MEKKMQKIIYVIVLLSLCVSQLQAKSLTILSDEKDGEIFLNGVYIGKELVNNYPVEPGMYNLTLKKQDEIIYKQTITIKQDQNLVIDTSRFVGLQEKSTIVDLAPKQIEKKRIRKATKGPIGLGGIYSHSIAGGSVKWNVLKRVGIQAIGWASTNDQEDITNELNYRVRLFYELQETLLSTNSIIILYSGIGYGNEKKTYKERAIFNDYDLKMKKAKIYETFIGVEYLLFSNFYLFFEGSIYNEDLVVERWIDKKEYNSINSNIGAGIHFFFN